MRTLQNPSLWMFRKTCNRSGLRSVALHKAGRTGVCHCMMCRKLPFVHIIYHTMIITGLASS